MKENIKYDKQTDLRLKKAIRVSNNHMKQNDQYTHKLGKK